MRTFQLHRVEDVSGVSGTGVVAEGVEFTDGTVAMRWHGDSASTVLWPDIDTAMRVHGHDGRTQVVWGAIPRRRVLLAASMADAKAYLLREARRQTPVMTPLNINTVRGVEADEIVETAAAARHPAIARMREEAAIFTIAASGR